MFEVGRGAASVCKGASMELRAGCDARAYVLTREECGIEHSGAWMGAGGVEIPSCILLEAALSTYVFGDASKVLSLL